MVWRPDKEFLELIDEINRLNGMLKAIDEERIRYGGGKSHYLIEQVAYDYAEKREYFLGIGYWKKLSRSGLSGVYTTFRYKEQAESLIESYKNGEIKELEDNVVGYY